MINKDIISTNGNTHPASIPFWRLSFAYWVIFPTRLGPKAPPKSPAIASSANIAVPPVGSRLEEILIVPGHIIPTENPQTIHPIRPTTGFADIDAIK